MLKVSFLYFVFVVLLFIGSVSFLDDANARVSPELNEELQAHRWVITKVHAMESGEDLTQQHTSIAWEFLAEGSFVMFEDDVIGQKGMWNLEAKSLQLKPDASGNIKEYAIERLRRNELILQGEGKEIRLLKLVN